MSVNRINAHSAVNIYNSNKNINKVEKANKVETRDRIEISALGKSIKDYSLESSIDNTKKVAEIKEKIQNGTYNIDSKLTAKSILEAIKENKK
ncbi:flagellar biosynthesis anti-sigma factor FlgM [Clostridium botulinum]|uniref:Flagellar biosynthesis anti-sigma factor FlgM n=1 Tax=Clostridium botulinum TaxID=1491 RepID=A0A0M1LCS2_CLOBO|nr:MULTISPECIES: flagellar biosynthesis anti-sigma factor FlgM [Clostridium]KAI3350314.1 flagellar biosynthesis anti-sigma factor FlgM [Clostridium botulinum]KOM88157.1 flagellar biosynthesis anti-sigma factor FlgM [Clostridium botulinum]KOR55436.1 flagellar biosynthesis protein FlgM [Clostridium botulinum]MBN1034620.1 flagellar biosynthesis anti-sigma factor FlgM [Clostridium botulinum]MBY7023879.1 flagellar biosynthesis anti-sigma factor FlgM [Clostridium botulinum]